MLPFLIAPIRDGGDSEQDAAAVVTLSMKVIASSQHNLSQRTLDSTMIE